MAAPQRAGGKVSLWLRRLLLALCLALVVQTLEYYGWLASPEGILLDFFLGRIPLLDLLHPANSANIATLEIDDDAFNQCFGRSPMDPTRIKPLLQAASEAHPLVIGVDIITDSEDPHYRAGYNELESLFNRKIDGQPPVVWAAGATTSSVDEAKQPSWEWFFGEEPIAVQPTRVLGKERELGRGFFWALPIYPHDQDARLRRFPRFVIIPPGVRQRSWAAQVAQLYCEHGGHGCRGPNRNELFVSFQRSAAPQNVKMLDLFDCSRGPARKHSAAEATWEKFVGSPGPKLVLIGGTFSLVPDMHPTPIGPLHGLDVNAYAVRAEVAGTGVSEVPPWLRLLLDIGLGLAIASIFHVDRAKRTELNPRISRCLGCLLGTVCLSAAVVYAFNYVWLSCVGIALGMTIHVFIEIWKQHLVLPPHKGHSGRAPRGSAHRRA